jgi:hypothetical protein
VSTYQYTEEAIRSLAEVEAEVIAESREMGRKRLDERLQELGDQPGEGFPLSQRKHRKPSTSKPRVEWRETNTGVFYLQERAAWTQGGRGPIEDKVVGVSSPGIEPMGLNEDQPQLMSLVKVLVAVESLLKPSTADGRRIFEALPGTCFSAGW